MPYAEVQRNSGSFNATSGSATFSAGTTAGNTVVLLVAGSSAPGLNVPTGFTRDYPNDGAMSGTVNVGILRKSNCGAGETSYSITMTSGTAKVCCWMLIEYDGIDLVNPVNTSCVTSVAAASDRYGNTDEYPDIFDGLAVGAAGAYSASATVPVFTGDSATPPHGVFVLLDQVGATNGSTVSTSLAQFVKPGPFLQTEGYVGQLSALADAGQAGLVVYACAGAKKIPDLRDIHGFELGAAPGLTSGAAATATLAPFAATAGTFSVEAAAVRTGTYGLRVNSSAAISNVQMRGHTDVGVATRRVCFRFRSALPGADLRLFSVNGAAIWYRAATQKLGAVVGSGTEQPSSATVSAGHWIGIDLLAQTGTTTQTLDWQVDYNADVTDTVDPVAQTRATWTGTAVTGGNSFLGWAATSTGDVDYDDYAASVKSAHYPLGNIRVWPMPVDQTVTPTNPDGTLSDFALVTANATGTALAAGNLTTARDNIAEVPVVVGATAAGVCQKTAGIDTVRFELTSRNAAANAEAIMGAKMYVCGWQATTSGCNITFDACYDADPFGLYVRMLDAAATIPAFGTSTAVWVCSMIRDTSFNYIAPRWTQATLDAVALKIGYSTDATPDIGVLGVVGEVAMREGASQVVSGAYLSSVRDPDSQGVIQFVAQAPANGDLTYNYVIGGSSTGNTVTAGSQASVDIADAGNDLYVTDVTVYPPAEPVTLESGPV